MHKRILPALAVAVGLLLCGAPLMAHHGAAAYDNTTMVTLSGTVMDFQFIQPHPIIALDVKEADGSVTHWSVELTAPNHLVHYGWSGHKLHAGQEIKVMGHVSKDGKKVLNLNKIYDSDGKLIPLGPPPPPNES